MNNNDFLDIISVSSFLIAIQNLQENEEQSKDLKEHLKNQDGVLFEQTNIYLKQILENQNKIIKMLGGDKNG